MGLAHRHGPHRWPYLIYSHKENEPQRVSVDMVKPVSILKVHSNNNGYSSTLYHGVLADFPHCKPQHFLETGQGCHRAIRGAALCALSALFARIDRLTEPQRSLMDSTKTERVLRKRFALLTSRLQKPYIVPIRMPQR